ncbi:helix-turn-helix transcriptional regulator [Candidatus Thiodictyon syntrophicum]|jgi:prophage regulatory protein|uniref:AlpA family phage regulatory protein n=1 Tax=Candidatus Thiodictyon syntrophicum TaxID=1166950 RepID=A0A2K8UBC9_9GAMM|nr:hypothetical protein THSYN_18430 [Candidatus Thiodictyon syntrophicum]
MNIIRIGKVTELTSLGRSTIYEMIKKGHFPAQKKISTRRVGWLLEDVENWIRDLSSGGK